MADEPKPTVAPPSAPAGGTVRMYTADGQEAEVPAGEVRKAFLSGQLGFGEGQKIVVTKRDGSQQAIDAAEAEGHFRSIDGYIGAPMSPEAYARQEEAKAYGGVGAGAGAFAAEAANAATLGISGVALRELAPELADKAEKAIQYNPNAALAGTIAGSVAPALVSGGTSAAASGSALTARGVAGGAARLATAPARGAMALGTAAEGLAARGLLGAGAAEGGALLRIGSKAIGQAVEGGIQAIGMAAGDAALKDDPVTAEKLVAAGLMGGAMGALVGGGLEGLSMGASRAIEGSRGALGRLASAVDGEESALAKAMTGRGSAVLDDVATRKAIQSTNAGMKALEELAERGDEAMTRVATIIREELPASTGRRSLAGGNGKGALGHAEMAEAADGLRRKSGKAIGDLMGTLDEAASGLEAKGVAATELRPDVQKVATMARAEVLMPLEREVFRKGEARQLKELIDDLAEKGDGLTLKELHAKRSNLDDKIFESKVAGHRALQDSYGKVRNLLEEEIAATAEKIGQKADLGSGFAAKYESAKQAYADRRWIADATEKGAAREASNRSFGFSEQFGALGGLALGGLSGGALGVAGALAQNYGRRFGDQLVAAAAGRAAKDGALRAIAETVDDAVGGAVGRFFGKSAGQAMAGRVSAIPKGLKSAAVAASTQTSNDRVSLAERYKKERDELAVRQSGQGSHLAKWTAPIADVNPKLALRVAEGAAKVDANIAAKMAQTQRGSGYMPAIGRERLPSPQDMSEIVKYIDGARDPMGVVKEIGEGKLDRSKIQALKENYPGIFKQIQADTMREVSELKKPLPYQKTMQIGLLLDVPVDGTLEPGFIATMQDTYAAASSPPQDTSGPMPASGPTPRISRAFTSRGDALAGGESDMP